MKLIDFVDLLDTMSKGFADYEVVISREGGTYCVVNIEIDSSKHVITLVDSSEQHIDTTIHDAKEQAGECCRKPEWPVDVDLDLV